MKYNTILAQGEDMKHLREEMSRRMDRYANEMESELGRNTEYNSHSGGPASSTQTLVGTQAFGQNQYNANTDNARAIQNPRNEQVNMDNNAAGGTAPTAQAIFSDNQKLGQTQTVSSSSGSNTQDSDKQHAESKR